MRERRFQSRITLTDIQRIRVISYIKQIFHTRLACTSPIGKAQLADFRKSVTKINVRSKIEHISFYHSIYFGLLIIQSGVLRLQRYSKVQSIFLADNIKSCINIMVIIFILSILTQISIFILFISYRQAITKIPKPILSFICIRNQAVGTSVTFTIFILKFITEL